MPAAVKEFPGLATPGTSSGSIHACGAEPVPAAPERELNTEVDYLEQPVGGAARIGPKEQSWQLVPRQAWEPGSHQLIAEPILEDLAGNSVSRVFDRDLTSPEDQPQQVRPVTLAFHPP